MKHVLAFYIIIQLILFISCRSKTANMSENNDAVSDSIFDNFNIDTTIIINQNHETNKYTKIPKQIKQIEIFTKNYGIDSLLFYQHSFESGHQVLDSICTYKKGKIHQLIYKRDSLQDEYKIDEMLAPISHFNDDNYKDLVLRNASWGSMGAERIVFIFNRKNEKFELNNIMTFNAGANLIYKKNKNYYITRTRGGGNIYHYERFRIKNDSLFYIDEFMTEPYFNSEDNYGIYKKYIKGKDTIEHHCKSMNDIFKCPSKINKLEQSFLNEYKGN